MKKREARAASFESSLVSLEKIVRELERGDLPLERSLELFEEGVRLSRECQERLNHAERRIELLLHDNEGQPIISEFDEEAVSLRLDETVEEADEDESIF
jgi:exodeoxyribonuclease VII small subunit